MNIQRQKHTAHRLHSSVDREFIGDIYLSLQLQGTSYEVIRGNILGFQTNLSNAFIHGT